MLFLAHTSSATTEKESMPSKVVNRRLGLKVKDESEAISPLLRRVIKVSRLFVRERLWSLIARLKYFTLPWITYIGVNSAKSLRYSTVMRFHYSIFEFQAQS